MAADPPHLIVRDTAAWRTWLAENVDERAGVWLVLAKKGTTDPTSLSYAAALEEALCHGWIDGQARRRDEDTYVQRFTPRRRRSMWSQRNVGIVERLTAEGRMHPQGLSEVARAKADGRWEVAYAGPATAEIPADLTEALAGAAPSDDIQLPNSRVRRGFVRGAVPPNPCALLRASRRRVRRSHRASTIRGDVFLLVWLVVRLRSLTDPTGIAAAISPWRMPQRPSGESINAKLHRFTVSAIRAAYTLPAEISPV